MPTPATQAIGPSIAAPVALTRSPYTSTRVRTRHPRGCSLSPTTTRFPLPSQRQSSIRHLAAATLPVSTMKKHHRKTKTSASASPAAAARNAIKSVQSDMLTATVSATARGIASSTADAATMVRKKRSRRGVVRGTLDGRRMISTMISRSGRGMGDRQRRRGASRGAVG